MADYGQTLADGRLSLHAVTGYSCRPAAHKAVAVGKGLIAPERGSSLFSCGTESDAAAQAVRWVVSSAGNAPCNIGTSSVWTETRLCRPTMAYTGVHRSGGSTVLRDPMAVLGAASVLLPALLSGYNGLLSILEDYGGQSLGQLRLLLKLAALCLVAACVCKPLTKLCKVVSGARRRSKMLRHLPGPSYGLLGILPLLRRRHDVHRMVTEWAEVRFPVHYNPLRPDCDSSASSASSSNSVTTQGLLQEYGPIFRVRVVLFQV